MSENKIAKCNRSAREPSLDQPSSHREVESGEQSRQHVLESNSNVNQQEVEMSKDDTERHCPAEEKATPLSKGAEREEETQKKMTT